MLSSSEVARAEVLLQVNSCAIRFIELKIIIHSIYKVNYLQYFRPAVLQFEVYDLGLNSALGQN